MVAHIDLTKYKNTNSHDLLYRKKKNMSKSRKIYKYLKKTAEDILELLFFIQICMLK